MCGERKCITFLTELDRVNNKHQVRGITLLYRMLRCGTMRTGVTSERRGGGGRRCDDALADDEQWT